MTTPETERQGISKEEQSERFRMIINLESSGLTLGEQASLIERYEELEWRDEEAIQWYNQIFAEIQSHPNEFVATATTFEHGTGLDILLLDQDKLIRRNTVGGVLLDNSEPINLSRRIPGWDVFPRGVEIFVANNPDTYPATHVTYSTPQIDLTNARLTRSHGQNQPQNIDVLAGNLAIASWVSYGLQQNKLTEQAGLDIALAAATIAEAHNVDPILVPELADTVMQSEVHYERQYRHRLEHMGRISERIGKLLVIETDLHLTAKETAKKYRDIPSSGQSNSMQIRDHRGWPADADAAFELEESHIESAISSLKRMSRELERNQLPFAKFYLESIRRYIKTMIVDGE